MPTINNASPRLRYELPRFALTGGARACELDFAVSATPSSGAHALPGSPQRHPDTGSKTRRWLLRVSSHCRLQLDLSGVGPAKETAGAPHGPAGGPCAVNWIRVPSASLRENSRARRTGLSRGQQYRRPSPHVLPLGSCDLGLHVLSNSQVPRTELYIGPKLRGSRASRALCKSKALHNASQTTAQLTSTAQHTATTS